MYFNPINPAGFDVEIMKQGGSINIEDDMAQISKKESYDVFLVLM